MLMEKPHKEKLQDIFQNNEKEAEIFSSARVQYINARMRTNIVVRPKTGLNWISD